MSSISYYTEEGLAKLRHELQHLKGKERADIAQQLADARAQGDLSENAEYDAAKDAQGLLELKIAKLENTIAYARTLSPEDIDTSKVSVLSKVKVKTNGREVVYQLVSEEEADLKAGRISVQSPIGKGLLGKAVGETVTIEVPAGKVALTILSIEA